MNSTVSIFNAHAFLPSHIKGIITQYKLWKLKRDFGIQYRVTYNPNFENQQSDDDSFHSFQNTEFLNRRIQGLDLDPDFHQHILNNSHDQISIITVPKRSHSLPILPDRAPSGSNVSIIWNH